MAGQKIAKVTPGVNKQSSAKTAAKPRNASNKAPTVGKTVFHLAGRKTLSGAHKIASVAQNRTTGYLKDTFVEQQDILDVDVADTVKGSIQQVQQIKNSVQKAVSTVGRTGERIYKIDKAIKKKKGTGKNTGAAGSGNPASQVPAGSGSVSAASKTAKPAPQTAAATRKATVGKTAGKTRSAATAARTAAGTAKTARTAKGTVKTVAKAAAVPATAAKAAAKVTGTAGTGGVAAVITVPLGLVRKLGEIMNFRRENNPLKRIFGHTKNSHTADVDMISGVFGHIASSLLIIPIILMLLTGAVFGGVCVIGDMLLSSPLRYLYFDSEELSAIAADNPEYGALEYSEFQALYERKINELKEEAEDAGCRTVTMKYHAEAREASNYTDVLACFLGNYLATDFLQNTSGAVTTVSDLFVTDSAKELFTDTLEQMCTLKVSGSGNKKKAVISLMTCEEYITASDCSQEIAEDIRTLYRELSKGNSAASGSQELPADTQEYLQELVSQGGIQGTVISFALSVQGTPYSQAYRNSGDYYDCSSFVYYCYRSAGISMSYGGANTAAAEAQYCQEYGQIVEVEDLEPGDLLFYSYVTNGRYKNISHVEMYLGNGLIIDCTETPGVAVRQFTTDRLVLCGRPY